MNTPGMTSESDELLSDLDDRQREAVVTLRGPVCVRAGAGTGKTRVVTRRIAHGIATGAYTPDRVLALTFTNRAAGEMSSRLRALGASGVDVGTFHATALRQLRFFWPLVVGGDAPRLLESKARLIVESAKNLNLRVDPAVLRDVASDIERRKVSNLGIEQYASTTASVLSLGAGMSEELPIASRMALHEEYERLKEERRIIDFEDVLLLTAGLLANEEMAREHVHQRYRTFVVDEFQDVSPLQYDLLSLWMGDHQDICVVGDANQTIYSFTGATQRYLLDFPRVYPNASVVDLETNYRSTEAIVDVANKVVRAAPGDALLQARRRGGLRPEFADFANDVAEASAIAAKILGDLSRGIPPAEIAILYRINAQSALLEQALADAGVSYQVSGSSRFFDIPEVKQAIMTLRGAAVSETNDPLFKSVSDVMRSLGWTQDPPAVVGARRAAWEALNAIVELADGAPAGTTLREFSSELSRRAESGHEPQQSSVTLSTIHAAKGLEWAHVYVVGASEGLIPLSLATTAAAIEEERRLLYVALTRARDKLTVTWSRAAGLHGSSRRQSRFLEGLDTDKPDARKHPRP